MNTLIRTKNEEGLYFDILDIGKSIEVDHMIYFKGDNFRIKEINYLNEPLIILDGDKFKIVFREVVLG